MVGAPPKALHLAVHRADIDAALCDGDAVRDGRGFEFEAGALFAGFGVHGPHFGAAATIEGVFSVDGVQRDACLI